MILASYACRNTRQWWLAIPVQNSMPQACSSTARFLVSRSDHRDALLELQDPHRAARTHDHHEGTEPDHRVLIPENPACTSSSIDGPASRALRR